MFPEGGALINFIIHVKGNMKKLASKGLKIRREVRRCVLLITYHEDEHGMEH